MEEVQEIVTRKTTDNSLKDLRYKKDPRAGAEAEGIQGLEEKSAPNEDELRGRIPEGPGNTAAVFFCFCKEANTELQGMRTE